MTRHRDFQVWMEQLIENQTYTVGNGEPSKNDFPLKVCENKLKLVFNRATIVCREDLPDIPPNQYKFKPIYECMSKNYSYDLLYSKVSNFMTSVRYILAF